eukprot:8828042-Pyramimonas_sp.AAC.1
MAESSAARWRPPPRSTVRRRGRPGPRSMLKSGGGALAGAEVLLVSEQLEPLSRSPTRRSSARTTTAPWGAMAPPRSTGAPTMPAGSSCSRDELEMGQRLS